MLFFCALQSVETFLILTHPASFPKTACCYYFHFLKQSLLIVFNVFYNVNTLTDPSSYFFTLILSEFVF